MRSVRHWNVWRRWSPAPATFGEAEATLFARIRRRLTLWYSGVLAAGLLLFGVLLYAGVSQALLGPVDQALKADADRIGAQWQAFPVASCDTLGVARHEALWACFDPSGVVQDISPLAASVPAFTTNTSLVTTAAGSQEARDTVDGGPNIGAIRRYAEAVPRPVGGGILGVIVIGTFITGQSTALHVLLVLLLGLGLLLLVVASGGGLFLAHRALAPARLAVARQQAFVTDVSHELRTPLTLLRSDAEVLLRGRDRLDPDDAELLEDIVTETGHMSDLITNMLTLARLDAGRLAIKRDVVDLAEIASRVGQRVQALADERAVTVEAQHGMPVLTIGDGALLEQGALILVDNAIKYNKPRGIVVLRTRATAERAVLEVVDSGVGIAPEDLARLGTRFYRVDKARTHETGSVGIGLSIARGIATAHRGTLTLTSVVGEGTTATLSLPPARI